jgi:hypothetical protein
MRFARFDGYDTCMRTFFALFEIFVFSETAPKAFTGAGFGPSPPIGVTPLLVGGGRKSGGRSLPPIVVPPLGVRDRPLDHANINNKRYCVTTSVTA